MSDKKDNMNVLKHFTLNFKTIIIDEIALEGLEGISFDLLWRRVALRISCSITPKMKNRFWKTIVDCNSITLYYLPEPLPTFDIIDRFTCIEEETGDLRDEEIYLDGPYEYCPVPNEYGSCKYYATRKEIPKRDVSHLTYDDIVNDFGDKLVMVASIEERWRALASHVPITYLQQLKPPHYCVLELIGKARHNGQTTTGTSNLTNIVKEPKNLFYIRKLLKNLNIIKVLHITQSLHLRGTKSLLLRLNRFHKPGIMTIPKVGKIHNVVEYLKNMPHYAEKTDVLLKKGLLTQLQSKKLRKTHRLFQYVDKILDDEDEPESKKLKLSSPSFRKKGRYITISAESDNESSQSEEEQGNEEIKCQYKVGVGLMRQAYERLLEAGSSGLSQNELAFTLGIEFYACRMLCKIFKDKKIVREFFEDKGKQRISRYVAIAARHANQKYIDEKNKFLQYISQNQTVPEPMEVDNTTDTSQSELIDVNKPSTSRSAVNMSESKLIIEEAEENKSISFENMKKELTLRQLKFGNGLIKVINERLCISGYQTLTTLVAQEIKEPPMVTKALKSFLQKLVTAGLVKIFKVKWPGMGQEFTYMNLICAPHLKASDPIVISKYKEVYLKAVAKRPPTKKEPAEGLSKPLAMLIHPRYMKIQNLHEYLMKMAYFEPETGDQVYPKGFLTITDLLPEITVKFAVSSISNIGIGEISHLKIEDCHYGMRLKDAPPDISHGLIKCKSLRNAFRTNIKALGILGLLQLIDLPEACTTERSGTLVSFLFYMNRRATIIDTSGTWPRDNVDTKSLQKSYYFETSKDVEQFWRDVYEISIATQMKIPTHERTKKSLRPPRRRMDEIDLYDTGERYGDGRGPCGYDSCFYMEISRLWRTYYLNANKVFKRPAPKPVRKPAVKLPKIIKKKKPRQMKKKRPKSNPATNVKGIKDRKTRKRVSEQAISWSKLEDSVIVMCKVAITIASPTSQPGCLRVRNMVARDILTLSDPKKCTSVCHRRALSLQSNSSAIHEQESLLNEMLRRRPLIQKYEGLVRVLRTLYSTNLSKFMNEARVPLLELVYLIWKVSTSLSYIHRLPCVAGNAHDFHENFDIVPATGNQIYNIYKSPEYDQLRESVLLTIILSHNNEINSEVGRKIYNIYKNYPENSLRIVIEQLRKCGAISAKEKLLNNQMHRMHLEDICSSAYKVSAIYQRRWSCRLTAGFVDTLAEVLEVELPQNNIKGSAELNCVFSELQATYLLRLVTDTKPDIVDVMGFSSLDENNLTASNMDTKCKLRSGTVRWECSPGGLLSSSLHVSNLYKNIDYYSLMQNLTRKSVVYIEKKQQYDMEDVIIKHLHEKGEAGARFSDLLEISGYNIIQLKERLNDLESENIVKCVGLNENVLVLVKFIKKWTLQVDDRFIICTPWLTLHGQVRPGIFLDWVGVIMNKIFECPGCSVAYISESLDYITFRAVQDACVFLEQSKCISLKIIKRLEPSLFAEDDETPEISEFNPFDNHNDMLAHPLTNCLSRYAYLRKTILDKHRNEST